MNKQLPETIPEGDLSVEDWIEWRDNALATTPVDKGLESFRAHEVDFLDHQMNICGKIMRFIEKERWRQTDIREANYKEVAEIHREARQTYEMLGNRSRLLKGESTENLSVIVKEIREIKEKRKRQREGSKV